MEAEKLLPKSILDISTLSGREYAWKVVDVPKVFDAALAFNLAILGGQLQFRIPKGTCELYWVDFESTPKSIGENWKEYVNRSFEECNYQFSEIMKKFNFVEEGIKAFSILKEMQESGQNISDYACFVIYLDSVDNLNG